MFAMAGIMQGVLLVLCLFWKRRQSRLGIDDYGRPLTTGSNGVATPNGNERMPLLGQS